MTCIYCNTQLPEKAFFCHKCTKQVRCKQCKEELIPDAQICISCGNEVGQKILPTNMNKVEFFESETERRFTASFTDFVGESISDSFGLILNNKLGKRHPISVPATVLPNIQLNSASEEIEVKKGEEESLKTEPKFNF